MNPNSLLNDPRYVSKNWFTYDTAIPSSLAPAAATVSTFNIDGDSDFFLLKLACHAVSASDGTTVSAELLPEVNIIITNTTNGRRYMNQAVPVANICGSGKLPFILPMQTFFPNKSTIQVDYTNASDNTTYSALYLDFIGIKAYLR